MEKVKLTKNLKLKIKNAQLTKAAGLDKLKQKLAQAGSSEAKSSSEKPSAKEKSVKVALAATSTPTASAEQASPESTSRRIRAKNRSSFSSSEEESSAHIPVDTSEPAPVSIADPEPELEVVDEVCDESPEVHPVAEVLPEQPVLPETPPQEKELEPKPVKPAEPKSVVMIKSKFGPTGKHINHLLAKTFKAPAKEEKVVAGSKSTKPVASDKTGKPGTSEGGEQNNREKQFNPANRSPASGPKRDAGKKNLTDFRDRSKKSDESLKAFTGRDRYGLNEGGEEDRWRKKRVYKPKKHYDEASIQRPTHIKISLPITVKDLATEMKLKASEVIQKLFIHGMTYVVNDILDSETAVQFIGLEFGCTIDIDYSEQDKLCLSNDTVRDEIQSTDPSKLVIRSPIVAFMGHVDHGKTTLIDSLRKSNVAATEAGAITQHMGAFCCSTPVGDITILDTPGHEAFSAMRARGAEVCDIVVLVVAGDEGIKEQTLEAIEHAKAADIAIVVAINKCDKPNFNSETIYRQLSEINLLPEAWGGSTVTVNTSAKTGEGLSELLEMLALQAEVLELKADPSARARGLVIESELHKGLGPVATVLIQNGSLKLGEALVFNDCYGKVKTMHNEHNELMKEAGPSIPVLITGLSDIPKAGDPFFVVKNEKTARDIIEARSAGQQRFALQQKKRPNFDSMLQNKKTLKLMIKADVQGSIEALVSSISKIKSEKVDVEILTNSVGEISESDIRLAAASKAVLIGFHTGIESHAEPLIKSLGVRVELFTVIYHAIDAIKEIMTSLLDPIAEEKDEGSAEIKEIFRSSQVGSIYGCIVTEGIMTRNHKVRVLRNKEILWKGTLSSLKRVKEDVKEVRKGLECGILLEGYQQAQIGDVLQCYEVIYHPQKL
ncbi:translation initiation factor IF-2 [Chlamydia pneumoniae]|uniref:Translation initiation factor IF-2 n=2 Tax=Chlamydia pneumoniae TaxID=83558 RepID=IF2_CHLPN|nr:translation initiation factor IF-2 [Chlamydia pneumoniae]Q9Z8M1.2 RecName: Full=Translation initiation factor IF-2 [Chlamydia pneumoniae]AAF38279.1 translation initiation factor 2 [Chlamydia pneumoniae AR39]CRI35681.1 Translation initiation factor IF-2 [Chlamydia pneumoniae]CRI41329.1 Translation initiation factor IF-2 [Chlamydia pneumoniae]CRI72966.1 Translation initiation factor IF-2 [Chlamydia pneumoniae]BAA98527.1 initiation factor-2 [Chlamydia pneumoniae J138]